MAEDLDLQLEQDQNETKPSGPPRSQYEPPSMTPISRNVDPKVSMPATGELNTFDSKELSEQGAKILRERAKAGSLNDDALPNLHMGGGINLLPTMTEEEIVIEKRAISANMFAAVAIVILVLVTLGIYGYMVIVRLNLRNERVKLQDMENRLYSQQQILKANNDILLRFDLYESVQKSTFSPKEVLVYWRDLVSGYGTLQKVELSGGMGFKVEGDSNSLRDTAFLWHLIIVDEKVDNANLRRFSKTQEGSTYSFDGNLNFSYFVNKEQENNSTDSSVQGINLYKPEVWQ